MTTSCGRPVILGAAYGYSADQLFPFLASAWRHVPGATVVLLRDRSDAKFLAEAQRTNPNVKVYLPRNRRSSRFWNRVAARGLLGALLTPWVSRTWQRIPASRKYVERFASAMMHVECSRFFAAAEYLDLTWATHESVLLTDTRDVVFQGDPFRNDIAGLVATAEPETIRNCVYNTWWFCRLYSWSDYAAVRDFPILCAGVTLGDLPSVRNYLSKVSADLMRFLEVAAFQFGYGQAVHNKVLQFDHSVDYRLGGAESCHVINLSHVNLDDCRLDNDGLVRDIDGIPFDIVHQYDRHPEILAAVQRQYRTECVSPGA